MLHVLELNHRFNLLLGNADSVKTSVFIVFDKTYLQKPNYVIIENISSNKKTCKVRLDESI